MADPTNIVLEWQAWCTRAGLTYGQGMDAIAKETGHRLDHRQLSRIRSGERPLPAEVHRYMARCIESPDWWPGTAEAFSPPARQ